MSEIDETVERLIREKRISWAYCGGCFACGGTWRRDAEGLLPCECGRCAPDPPAAKASKLLRHGWQRVSWVVPLPRVLTVAFTSAAGEVRTEEVTVFY